LEEGDDVGIDLREREREWLWEVTSSHFLTKSREVFFKFP
jgi:hypothetical protein